MKVPPLETKRVIHSIAARGLIQTFEDEAISITDPENKYWKECEIFRLGTAYTLASKQTSFVATMNRGGILVFSPTLLAVLTPVAAPNTPPISTITGSTHSSITEPGNSPFVSFAAEGPILHTPSVVGCTSGTEADDLSDVEFYYPADSFDAGNFGTVEIRPWDRPQLDNSKVFNYTGPFVTNATTKNFTASLQSWADTTLYSASMTYLEKNSHYGYTQRGVYRNNESRHWNQPCPKQSKRINFATPFRSSPHVMTWLQSLDMDKSKDWRIKVYPSNIDKNGFTIHADSWSDPILYSTGITWLAYSTLLANREPLAASLAPWT
ncbi:hypothetical protein SCAR479_06927 [Seiridium cardinale]|uniref:H-type lectin domain-containing protein n=1 Tax=Seiridium cardinale TaxID=138064 RepID=A0ABR2XRK2_9PEZI